MKATVLLSLCHENTNIPKILAIIPHNRLPNPHNLVTLDCNPLEMKFNYTLKSFGVGLVTADKPHYS